MKIITEFPLWLSVFCFAFGLIVAFLTYYKRFSDNLNQWQKRILPSLRFISASLLAFLLLRPLVLTTQKEIEKPLLVVAVDNSSSIVMTADSIFYKTDFINSLNNQIKELENQFDVKLISFGLELSDSLSFSYDEPETNLSSLFTELKALYSGRNVGAIVLASDGIYNKGTNPYFMAESMPYPIYSVLMGDTLIQKDAKISRVFYNRSVFKGNSFPLEIHINADLLSGKNTNLRIEQKGKVIFQKAIKIVGNKYSEVVRTHVEANNSGLQQYSIILENLDDEFSYQNNRTEIFVDVIEQQEKILIAYQFPHPDISAMRNALSSVMSYAVDVKKYDELSGDLNYQMVILYQIPSVKDASNAFLSRVKQQKIPLFYVLGNATNFARFNEENSGLKIAQNRAMWNDAFPSYNKSFVSFSTDKEWLKIMENLPPISVPFGSYQVSNSSQVMIYQRIGRVVSEMPLFLFSEENNIRSAVLCGEGIWRWRLMSYQISQSHQSFDDWFAKVAQYLMVSGDRSNLRVSHNRIFNENENLFFSAEFYNDAMERINEPELKFLVKDEDGKNYPFVFSRTSNAYDLNAGRFPQGNYEWEAQTSFGGKLYQKKGAFSVRKIDVESLNLLADKNLMLQMARVNDGAFITAREVDELANLIKNNESIRSVSYFVKKFTDLSSLWLYFVFLIFLFSLEWFIRKFNGMS
jgi:hypothetical protein